MAHLWLLPRLEHDQVVTNMPWVSERVDQLVRRHERLSVRPLDQELLEAIDALDVELARWKRLMRLARLPDRPTRIPVDAAAIVARITRAVREERPSIAVELERPTGRRRVLLDAPAAELAIHCFVELLLSRAPDARRLKLRLDIESDLALELQISVDVADDCASAEELELVHRGLTSAGLDWAHGATHRLRPKLERAEPTARQYVFPPPNGCAR